MCLAQGPQRSDAVRLEPATPRSRVEHSTTEPLRSRVRYMIWATVYYRDVLKGPTDDTQTKFSCD